MNTATQLRICAISLALLCACAKATAPDAAPASDAQNAAANVQAALSDAAAADTAVSDDTGDAPKNTEQDSDVAAAADIASPVYNVVFFGNSYTYVNDLPTMVAKFAAEDGVTVKVDSWTGGGATMAALFLNVDVQKLLAKGGWTHVVLQGQSMETAYGAAYLLEYCKKFADLIKPSKANLVWYSTWPRHWRPRLRRSIRRMAPRRNSPTSLPKSTNKPPTPTAACASTPPKLGHKFWRNILK